MQRGARIMVITMNTDPPNAAAEKKPRRTSPSGPACIQPDFPLSCSRLQHTAMPGMNRTMPAMASSAGIAPRTALNSTNHQYSERDALPSNVAYLRKHVLTDSENVIPCTSVGVVQTRDMPLCRNGQEARRKKNFLRAQSRYAAAKNRRTLKGKPCKANFAGLKNTMVGMAGFEPATPASRTLYSTRLSHIPCTGQYRCSRKKRQAFFMGNILYK